MAPPLSHNFLEEIIAADGFCVLLWLGNLLGNLEFLNKTSKELFVK